MSFKTKEKDKKDKTKATQAEVRGKATPAVEAEWCVATSGKDWKGPFTADQLREKVRQGEVARTAYIWRPGQEAWQRLEEVAEFKQTGSGSPPSFPALPAFLAFDTTRDWLIAIGQKQYGPFSVLEVRGFLQQGKVNGQTLAWMKGRKSWEPVEKIAELMPIAEELPRHSPEADGAAARTSGVSTPRQSRVAQRRPLAARIFLTDDARVLEGVSHDISAGGLSVVADSLPGGIGDCFKLNITPVASAEREGAELQPFVAEARIVRRLQNGRGFSFRFVKLSENARRAIEAFAARAS